MKTFFYLLILSICFKANAQTERYIYKTVINPDTVNLVNTKVENTFLDVKDGQSIFISEQRILRDSLSDIVKKSEETSSVKKKKKEKSEFPKLANGQTLQSTLFEYFITKDINAKNINLVENIGPKQIYYTEDRPMNWIIDNETSTYNGYKVQKARLEFGGRNWTAWFSEDINLSDGPYKFYGLPGLILKLEDEIGDYKFSFIKKITINDAFVKKINYDARQSTRQNFLGDKASIIIENKRNKNFDDMDPLFRSGKGEYPNGQPIGGNSNFGNEGPNGKMGMFQNEDQKNNKTSLNGWISPNPIELQNK